MVDTRLLTESTSFITKLDEELPNTTTFLAKLDDELPSSTYSQWTTFVPTITAGSGTITSANASIKYSRSAANLVSFIAVVNVVTNGTGAGFIRLTLPLPVFTGLAFPCTGRRANTTFLALNGDAEGSFLNITSNTGTYPADSGCQLRIAGFYQTT